MSEGNGSRQKNFVKNTTFPAVDVLDTMKYRNKSVKRHMYTKYPTVRAIAP
jgi:hypothetical protein